MTDRTCGEGRDEVMQPVNGETHLPDSTTHDDTDDGEKLNDAVFFDIQSISLTVLNITIKCFPRTHT